MPVKFSRSFLAALAVTTSLSACTSAPTEPKAKVGPPASAAATQAASAAAPSAAATQAASAAAPAGPTVTLALSPEKSKVGFVGAKVTASHEGHFALFTGSIDLVGDKPESSKVRLEVDMGSLAIDPPKLAGHLKSPDFFDIAQFPKSTFESTAVTVTPGGENGATHSVTGNLTMRGVTKSITFPAKITVSPAGVSATADFVINRKDFGVVYAGMADDLIKDDVVLKLALEAPRG
jgi:polyisoprenoid-binding protein YceI